MDAPATQPAQTLLLTPFHTQCFQRAVDLEHYLHGRASAANAKVPFCTVLLFLLDGWPRALGICIRSKMMLFGELLRQGRVQDRKVVTLLFPLIGWSSREVELVVFFVVIKAVEFTFKRVLLDVSATG